MTNSRYQTAINNMVADLVNNYQEEYRKKHVFAENSDVQKEILENAIAEFQKRFGFTPEEILFKTMELIGQ